MAAQAAHLVDCVLPAVPIRQVVLSFHPFGYREARPFELSRLAATKPEVLRALARIHAEELARHYLNLHVHLHTCARGGVYVEAEDGEAPRFVPRAPPSRAEPSCSLPAVPTRYRPLRFFLFLATSGMFMIAAKRGFVGRGAVLVGIGVAIPLLHVTFAKP
jgi:hypothetical protein